MGRILESFIVIAPGIFVVILLVVVGVYYLQRLRREVHEESSTGIDTLTQDFLSMRRDGEFTEEEFQAIRTSLSSRQRNTKSGV